MGGASGVFRSMSQSCLHFGLVAAVRDFEPTARWRPLSSKDEVHPRVLEVRARPRDTSVVMNLLPEIEVGACRILVAGPRGGARPPATRNKLRQNHTKKREKKIKRLCRNGDERRTT